VTDENALFFQFLLRQVSQYQVGPASCIVLERLWYRYTCYFGLGFVHRGLHKWIRYVI